MPSLTTLMLTTDRHMNVRASFDQWSLPCLRHLQIGNVVDVDELNQLLKVMLPLFGSGLKVLHVTVRRWANDEGEFWNHEDGLMDHLWDHCPQLECLHFPLYLVIINKPPRQHPLQYLINSDISAQFTYLLALDGNFPTDLKSSIIAFCQAVTGLLVVRDNHDWSSMEPPMEALGSTGPGDPVSNNDDVEEKKAYHLMMETVVQMRTLNMAVRFEDRNGRIWEESA